MRHPTMRTVHRPCCPPAPRSPRSPVASLSSDASSDVASRSTPAFASAATLASLEAKCCKTVHVICRSSGGDCIARSAGARSAKAHGRARSVGWLSGERVTFWSRPSASTISSNSASRNGRPPSRELTSSSSLSLLSSSSAGSSIGATAETGSALQMASRAGT